MPIFSYRCKDCGKEFDLLVGMTAQKEPLKCTHCGSKNITKQISGFSGVRMGKTSGSSSGTPSCPTGTCGLPNS